MTLLGCAALGAPWLAPGDPTRGDLTAALRSPSSTYLLGTDAQGRDVLSRVLFGARLSLAVGLASQVIALAAGLALGLTAGFYGRWVDAVVMRVADVTLAFPSLLLLIAVAAAVRPSLPVVCIVIGLVGWAGMARLVRGQVLVARGLDYVQAARALGASDARLVARHEHLPAHQPGHACPAHEPDHDTYDRERRSHGGGDGDEQEQRRECEGHVGDAHHHGVDPPAVEAGREAEREPRCEGDHLAREAHRERQPGPEEHAAQHVPSLGIGAEEVGRRRGAQRGGEITAGRVAGREPRRGERRKPEQRHDGEASQCPTVPYNVMTHE